MIPIPKAMCRLTSNHLRPLEISLRDSVCNPRRRLEFQGYLPTFLCSFGDYWSSLLQNHLHGRALSRHLSAVEPLCDLKKALEYFVDLLRQEYSKNQSNSFSSMVYFATFRIYLISNGQPFCCKLRVSYTCWNDLLRHWLTPFSRNP